ncbi:MAG: DinB family protein [bacterium]|nr:DinB family protein [bacterium]
MKKQDFIEQMQRVQKPLKNMLELVPEDKLDWAPGEGFMKMKQLLKHLSENWIIVKKMVTNDFPFSGPDDMETSMKLENLGSFTVKEALQAMAKDLEDGINYLENEISDEDFFNKVVSAPWGFKGEIWKAVGMANDHQIGHKMQLHIYLKMLGQPVHTGTLYGM